MEQRMCMFGHIIPNDEPFAEKLFDGREYYCCLPHEKDIINGKLKNEVPREFRGA